jgi:aspartyl-tRNA(Asn)/glutamyl-tRNA(Gln) amidotransferase subunit B
MYATGKAPAAIVAEKGWTTLKDTGAILALVDKVLEDNPQIVADIKEKGLAQKKGFLVGQVMRASQGKADPQEVNRLIEERLNQ